MWLKAVLLVICFTGSCVDARTWLPTEAQVIDYLEGMAVPDFQAEVKQRNTTFQYSLTNTKMEKIPRLGSSASYDLENDVINVKIHFPHIYSTGYISSVFTVKDTKTFKYTMEGNFTIHASESNLLLQVLLPKMGKVKESALILTGCSATYEALTMDLDAEVIKDPKDKDAMNKWLSKALHTTLSDLYCIGLRADVEKGLDSTIVQGIMGLVFVTAFPSG